MIPMATAEEKPPAGTNPLAVAKEDFRAENFERALVALDQLEKTAGPTGESMDLRGCIYMEQKRFEEAQKSFAASRAADPGVGLPRLHMGDLFLRQKKWTEAREVYEEAIRDTRIQMTNERLRYAVLLAYLGAQDLTGAKKALDRIIFPTETATYYYAQAAWAFAHGKKREGNKWLATAGQIFEEKQTDWCARPLYESGWIRKKPSPVAE